MCRLPATFLRAATLGAVVLAAALPAHAQWKWRDASGRITASDMPPPRGIPDKDILQRPAAAPRPAAATAPASAASAAPEGSGMLNTRPSMDKELEARRRAAEQEQQAKAKAEEEALARRRAENCQRARQQMASLASGQRIVRVNERGEREVLDDGMRADETRRTRDVIASECR